MQEFLDALSDEEAFSTVLLLAWLCGYFFGWATPTPPTIIDKLKAALHISRWRLPVLLKTKKSEGVFQNTNDHNQR
jgi:hypothetical protein